MTDPEETENDTVATEKVAIDRGTEKLYKIWQDPSQFGENEVQASYVIGSFPGILVAGCVYPFFMGASILLYEIVFNGATNQILIGIFMVIAYAIFGGVVGLIISCFTGMLSMALVIVMNRSLGYPLNARSAAISAGSLAGYAPTVWILFTPGSAGGFWERVAAGFLGPILAMTLGAIGAAWASSKLGGYDFNVATRRNKSKLSIMHIMIATAWIAVTFASANFFGGPEFAIAVAGWFVLQGFLLGFIDVVRKIASQRSLHLQSTK